MNELLVADMMDVWIEPGLPGPDQRHRFPCRPDLHSGLQRRYSN